MEVSTLQLFVAVVRQGSFAAVARDRNIDPSSVSRAIANLETELGVRLFQRTTRKLSPTEAGATYFERIEPLVEDLQQAGDLAAEMAAQPKGQLRVTASVSFGLKCIVPLLPAFQDRYPALTVDLLLTDAVVDLLTERVDVAIRLGLLADSTLIAQRLIPTRYAVCASRDYLARTHVIRYPTDLTQHNCLRFPLAGFRSQWLFRDRQDNVTGVNVQGQTVISNAVALRDCAAAGMGLALLPHWLIRSEISDGTLVNVLPHYDVTATDFHTAAWLVYPSRRYIPAKVTAFSRFFQAALTAPLS
ncbi:MAG: LysR substrate-binding domain-containing protein [Cyanobacteria bacterium J06632_22]